MSTVRKLLMAVLLMALASSAFGAGTFASFNASTTNAASTFQTGSVVLTNNNGANTCYSNGTSNNGAGTNTDANTNATCSNIFTAGTSKPGDTASQQLTFTNAGSIAAAGGFKVYKANSTNCVDGQSSNSASFYGTGSMCETLELNVHDDTGNLCLFGGGAAGEVASSAAVLANSTSTITIAAAPANSISINSTIISIPAGTYGYSMGGVSNQTTTNPTLETVLEDALVSAALPVMAGVGVDGKVYLASTVPGGAQPTVGNGTSGNTTLKTQLNLASPASVYTATQAASCTADPAHTVMNFTKSYTSSSPLSVVSSLAAGGTRQVTLGLALDSNAGNNYQGRLATFGLTWFESQ